MPDIEFSQAVISGLRMQGFSTAEIVRITATTPAHIDSVIAGREELSDAALDRIEDHSGKTAGQLAALAEEPNGGPLTEIANVWAEVHHSVKPSASQPRR